MKVLDRKPKEAFCQKKHSILFFGGFELVGYLVVDATGKVFHLHRGLFATALYTHTYKTIGSLLFAYDNHVGDALELVVTYLAADFFVAVVKHCTHTLAVEIALHLAGIVVELL